jgi:hypothetical protein
VKRPPLLLALLAGAVAGCHHNPPVTPGRTAIPTECKEAVPDRPAMPTDALKPGATTDAYVQAAEAEILLREGYEVKLRTALEACTKPIQAMEP